MKTVRRAITAGFFVFFVSSQLFAQVTNEEFGKNRIQYRNFDWQYLSGENFDVYYYDGRRELATEVLNYSEREFERLTSIIGWSPYIKTRIFLYNSLTDLRQSNVGLNKTSNLGGGETEFIKPYVEVAHMGTAAELKDELLYKISNLLINEMMFGGSIKDVFQSAILMNLPEWFVSGAALYISKGWSEEMDDYIRQVITLRKVKRINSFTGDEAALIGQSIWNFIAERYGNSSVGNVLNYTRVTRKEDQSVMLTLGINFHQMINEWQKFYGEAESASSESYVRPDNSNKFTPKHHATLEYTQVKISPDGKYIAFAENDRGRYQVKVRSMDNDTEITILSGGSKAVDQEVDYRMPLLDWSDPTTLGVIGVKNGKYVFWLYDLGSSTRLPRDLNELSNVQSINFSSNGRLAVLSADMAGQNDLFLLSTRRDRIRRLTNDKFDDLDPAFIPGSNKIVFSSNRTSDSLRNSGPKPTFDTLSTNFNFFVLDLDGSLDTVARISNMVGKNFAPTPESEGVIYYLSDQRGITNLFKFSYSTGINSQLTNFSSGIKKYDINFQSSTLATINSYRLIDDIFVDHDFNSSRQIFTPTSKRKEVQQLKMLRVRRKQEQAAPVDSIQTLPNLSMKDLIELKMREKKNEASDTANFNSEAPRITEDSLAVTQVNPPGDTVIVNEKVINTDNYKFDDTAKKEEEVSSGLLNRFMAARERRKVMGPFPYESKFSADNLVTSAIIDPMRGFGLQLESQMNDMLENYRFFGGIMSTVDLAKSDAYGEFQYLPEFIDFSARIQRKAIRWDPDVDGHIFNYSMVKLEIGASVPINERLRWSVKPFGAITRSVDQGEVFDPSSPPDRKPTNHFYAGVKSELVYDNSVTAGINLIEGTRGKLVFLHYQGIDDPNRSFSQYYIDLRHYQKLYKQIVLAVRGFNGGFFGNSPKKYLLGGMDNWVFNRTSLTGRRINGEINPLASKDENEDLLFVEYATNLRGFDYSTMFGNQVILFNAELRVPLIRALINGTIGSGFLRNLQFTTFYDIGTSWSSASPFSSEKSSVIRIVPDPPEGPFTVEIKEYLNPWLYSYGVGIRTTFLGYYTKLDLAWPVENYKVQDPRLMFTLGYDF